MAEVSGPSTGGDLAGNADCMLIAPMPIGGGASRRPCAIACKDFQAGTAGIGIKPFAMSTTQVRHIRREQQLIPEDVRTRQDYDDWLRTLPRASSDADTVSKRVPTTITVDKKILDDYHPDKVRAA